MKNATSAAKTSDSGIFYYGIKSTRRFKYPLKCLKNGKDELVIYIIVRIGIISNPCHLLPCRCNKTKCF